MRAAIDPAERGVRTQLVTEIMEKYSQSERMDALSALGGEATTEKFHAELVRRYGERKDAL